MHLQKAVQSSMSLFWRRSVGNLFLSHIACSSSATNSVPLSQSINVTPSDRDDSGSGRSQLTGVGRTEISRLSNGLRVATEERGGAFATIGLVVESGCRYEIAYPSGITNFLEKLAFCSTAGFDSRDEISKRIEEINGVFDCQAARDIMCYAMSACGKEGPALVVDVLSDVVMRPRFKRQELEHARKAIENEIESRNIQPDQDPFLQEMIHAAAFQRNTLGLPKFCPSENLPLISPRHLHAFMSKNFSPENMVLVGVGIDHGDLFKLAENTFLARTPIWESDSSSFENVPPRDSSLSQFTGGIVRTEVDLSNIALGPTVMPDLAHCVIGLESCSSTHKGLRRSAPHSFTEFALGTRNFVTFAVLNTLLGGGGSFSAGGPGKGMYTRLYINVLNQYHWVHNCTALNHVYSDTGLFTISGSAPPSKLTALVKVIIEQLQTIDTIDFDELERAKTQLRSFMLMNLESRPVAFEDIGRQVLAYGKRRSIEELIQLINDVSLENIRDAGRNLLRSKVAVAARGKLDALPSYQEICEGLVNGVPNLGTDNTGGLTVINRI